MSLFSISYRINQYLSRMYQFETKRPRNSPKPIYLKPLTQSQERVRGVSGGILGRLAAAVRPSFGNSVNHGFGDGFGDDGFRQSQ